MLTVNPDQVLRFRACASGLDHRRRLPPGSLGEAAYGGLQDTIPREALTALHARMEAATPTAWEDPSLWQIWFRGADYVVPREDFWVFTLGALPRQRDRAAALETAALVAWEVLAGEPRDANVLSHLVTEVLNDRHPVRTEPDLRNANTAGRYRIRWDTRTVTIIPTERPDVDVEEARLELARRFLGWHGPATCAQFAKWAAVSRADAAATWVGLGPEILSVRVADEGRHLLLRDEESLRREHSITGVRLLMRDDPCLAIDRLLVDAVAPRTPQPVADQHGASVTPRLLNSLVGRVLADGRLIGRWGRVQNRIAIQLWEPGLPLHERVRTEAETFAGPIGQQMQIRWLH